MKIWLMRIGTALAAAFLGLTLLNASWLAPEPKGAVKLVAEAGLQQLPADEGDCPAAQIEPPFHRYLPNTAAGIERAHRLGAPMVAVDVATASDGAVVLFGDAALDCRTDGSGQVRGKTLAELKALDAGHGYTADDGATYPLRGTGTGAIPTLAEALAPLPRRARLMYRFTGEDAAEADALAAALERAGRDPVRSRDAFTGSQPAVDRIRAIHPGAWAFSTEEGRRCMRDYRLLGWSGFLPASCRGGTMLLPLDGQFTAWGWPNRLIARMEEAGGHVLVTGPDPGNGAPVGLTLPEQLGEVPDSFNGYLLVADGFAVTTALHSRFDDRDQEEIDATTRAMAARRAR